MTLTNLAKMVLYKSYVPGVDDVKLLNDIKLSEKENAELKKENEELKAQVIALSSVQ